MNVDAREWCIREDITTFINHATIQNAQIAHCEEGRAPKREWAVGKGPRALTHLNDPYVRHRGHSVEHRGGISFALLSWHTFNSKPGRRHPVSLVRFGVFSFEVSSRAPRRSSKLMSVALREDRLDLARISDFLWPVRTVTCLTNSHPARTKK